MQAQVRKRTITEPIVINAILAKALLNPIKYDNYKLWRLMHDAKIDEALVVKVAEMIKLDNWIRLERGDGLHIAFPPERLFLMHLFSLFGQIEKKEQMLNIIKSCINPGFEDEIELIKNYYHAYNLITYREPIESDAADAVHAEHFLGHPKNEHAYNWGWLVFSGFVTALGAATVALALTLTVLSAPVSAAIAGVGIVTGLIGVGMFAFNAYEYSKQSTFKENYTPVL